VFETEEAAFAGVEKGLIKAGDVVVIRYEGPKGGPGMREMLAVTAALVGAVSAIPSRCSPTAVSPAPPMASWRDTWLPKPPTVDPSRLSLTETPSSSISPIAS